MKKLFLLPALLAAFGLTPAGLATAQTLTTLHSFGATFINGDGEIPQAGLVSSGGILYGTTYYSGNSGFGTVFSFNADGTGFKSIHSFTGITDGANPLGNLILSGNTLYGTTMNGGAGGYATVLNFGTVFKINTDGTGFGILYRFTPVANHNSLGVLTNRDGAYPSAGVILSGDTFYGTAYGGGTNGYGTVFAVNTNGTGFTVLHTFKPIVLNTNSDGAKPLGGLVLAGNTLYGTTSVGGTNGSGTVFAVNMDGTGFTNLYQFTPLGYNVIGYTNRDGANPSAGLILSGGTLYGTATKGGTNASGTVFSISTNGTGFTILCSFAVDVLNPSTVVYTNSTGAYPVGLLLADSTLYGTAGYGGTNGYGTVFAISTNGTGYTNLYSFNGVSDGSIASQTPFGIITSGALVLSGNLLYGTAPGGGTQGNNTGNGTLFGANTNGSGITNVHTFSITYANIDGKTPVAGLVLSGNSMYGTTEYGGSSGIGSGSVFAINTDGTGYTNLYDFTGLNDGEHPIGGLVLSGNTLYGTANNAGTNGNGAVFKINTDGTGFKNLYSFTGFNDGGQPQAGLILSGDTLYGTASQGGAFGLGGTVFAIHTDGTGFTNLYGFSGFGNDGGVPLAGLVLSGNCLYGTVSQAGTNGFGAVFAVNTNGTANGTGYTNLYSFTGGTDGGNPKAGLVLSAGTLYGTVNSGGTNGYGTVFKINKDGSGFKNLHSFTALSGSASTNSDGANPVAGLILSGNTLYGTAPNGGSAGSGVVFAINTDGTGFTNYSLGAYTDSVKPEAGLVLSGITLYGTAAGGTSLGNGTVFAFIPGSIVIALPPGITSITLSGTNLVINGTNGQSGGTYETLTSTNLVLPLNQWTPVATNVLNVNGNFTITATNAVNSADQQRFFRILQTQ